MSATARFHRVLSLFVGIFMALSAATASAEAEEDYSTWGHSALIRINTTSAGAYVLGTTQKFPLLIRIGASMPIAGAIFSQSLAAGADIRFSDPDGTHLDFQIDRYDDAAGQAEIWVLVPQIDGNSDKDYIRIHWGKSGAAWLSDGSKVFRRDLAYEGVWHLGEADMQTRGNSVGDFNHAVPKNYTGKERVAGIIGMADSLGGTSWNVDLTQNVGAHLDVGAGFADVAGKGFTFSVWAYASEASFYARFFDFGSASGMDNLILTRQGTSSSMYYKAFNASTPSNEMLVVGGLDEKKWMYLAVTQAGENVSIYKNGALLQSFKALVSPRNYTRTRNYLGRSNWKGDENFKGKLDDPQVSLTARSADWIKLAYQSQREDGGLLSFGAPTENPPPAPVAEPAAGAYFGPVSVRLTCAADNSAIFYTLDGSVPDTLAGGSTLLAGAPIAIGKSLVLKARAYRAGRAGPVLTAAYVIDNAPGPGGDSLFPGGSLRLDRSHTIVYPSQEPRAPVMVSLGAAFDPPLNGFDRLGPLFTVSATDNSAAFPGLLILADSGAETEVQLYRRDGGVNHWMPPKDGMPWVPSAGGYFWGRDIQPPRIRYAGSDPQGADSLRVSFAIEDNVANLRCRLRVYGGSEGGTAWHYVASGETISLGLRLPDGPGLPLELGMDATDESGLSQYPSGTGRRYSLERDLGPISAPVSLQSGVHWKLVGMPLIPKTPLTVGDLASESGSGKLVSVHWRTRSGAEGDYEWYGAKDALPAGKAFWLAAEKATPNLMFPPSKSIPSDSDGLFPIPLKGGWNLVTCPSLRALAWPVSNQDGESYLLSPLKGLRGFDGTGYTHADSLRPWEGYYVWYEGGDTVVRVGPGAARPGEAAKRGAGAESAPGGVSPVARGLRLGFLAGPEGSESPQRMERMQRLEIGAAGFARKGLGREDERLPPSLAEETGAWLVRDGRRLSTDYVAWNPEAVLSWTLASQGKPQGYPSGDRLLLETADLPAGHQAWAVSPARGMKYRLLPGSDIPLAGVDTLFIHAGTPEALAKLGDLIRGREAAGAFDCALRSAAGGLEIRINLPSAARVDVKVWTAKGSQAGGLMGVFAAAGSHTWNGSDLGPGLGVPARGVYLVEIRVKGLGWSAHRVEKFGAL